MGRIKRQATPQVTAEQLRRIEQQKLVQVGADVKKKNPNSN